jgi:hypothetical protein
MHHAPAYAAAKHLVQGTNDRAHAVSHLYYSAACLRDCLAAAGSLPARNPRRFTNI